MVLQLGAGPIKCGKCSLKKTLCYLIANPLPLTGLHTLSSYVGYAPQDDCCLSPLMHTEVVSYCTQPSQTGPLHNPSCRVPYNAEGLVYFAHPPNCSR